jgi:hypothetical protein
MSLQRADPSFRGFLPSVVCLNAIREPRREVLGPPALFSHEKKLSGGFPVNVITKLITPHPWSSHSDVRHLTTLKQNSVRQIQYNIVCGNEQLNRTLTARNQVRYSVYFGTAGIETITLAGTVVRSECFAVLHDIFN